MRLAEYLTHVLGRDSTTKLRHLTTQSLNHQILKFGGALITIDCAGLSCMDFGLFGCLFGVGGHMSDQGQLSSLFHCFGILRLLVNYAMLSPRQG